MEEIYFHENLPLKNFLNRKGITILNILDVENQIFIQNLVEEIERNNLMVRSTIFRYIKCFLEYDLVVKERRRIRNGNLVSYRLSDKGRTILEIFIQ